MSASTANARGGRATPRRRPGRLTLETAGVAAFGALTLAALSPVT